MRAIVRLLVCVSLAVLLASCGKNGIFDMTGDTSSSQNGNGNGGDGTGPTTFAACICGHQDGSVSALFNSQPGTFGASSFRVTATGCESLVLCEEWDGKQVVLQGTFTMTNARWSSNVNYYNHYYYEARGYQGASFQLPQVPQSLPRLVAFLATQKLGKIFRTAQTSPSSCQQLCEAADPSCLALNLMDQDAAGLIQLRKAVDRPTTIAAADVQKMFGVTDDPCGRGDTVITATTFSNSGGDCDLEAAVPQTNVSLLINVPKTLSGSIDRSGDRLRFTLDSKAPKPSVHFTPTDSTTSVDDANGMDADYGGEINEIFADAKSVGFGIGPANSCIMGTFN